MTISRLFTIFKKNLGNKSDIGSVTINSEDLKYKRVARSQVHAAELSQEQKELFKKLGYRTTKLNWSGHWLRAPTANHMDSYVGFFLDFNSELFTRQDYLIKTADTY